MLNIHLPLSDNARAWAVKILAVFYGVLFVPMIYLNFTFYHLGSLTPDALTGRTFPVQEHGTLYVIPWEGELSLWLFWGCVLVFALLVILNPYHGRLFLVRDEHQVS